MKNNVCASDKYNKCTGCGACSAVCPTGAVKITENADGFYCPVIDEVKCTECSLCTTVCYKFDSEYKQLEGEWYECYSAVNKSPTELKNSSSGGVSIELMRECIKQGYYVVGVAYDVEMERAVTKIAKSADELEQFKGSKYFQSYTADAFCEIVRDRSKQKYALFGTPCQIYAFSKLGDVFHNRERYLLVDIFCHGCPSLKLWDKYLSHIKEKKGVDGFDDIKFRSKVYGWHEYAFDFLKGGASFSSSKFDDPFHELFFGKDAMNEACYACVSRSNMTKADIRIGDFWGKRHIEDAKGVSAVVLVSERGKAVFDVVMPLFDCEKADFREIVSSQSYGVTHKLSEDRRNQLMRMLGSQDDITKIIKKYRSTLPFKVNMKRQIKSALKHLPSAVYVKLKSKLQ